MALSESAVQVSFRKIVDSPDVDAQALDRAEELFEHLRPESPLLHRLSVELEEIRKRVNATASKN